MPLAKSKRDWEMQEEINLMYVAYTRAKHKLGFISETEIPPSGNMLNNNKILNDIVYAERIVGALLGKTFSPDISGMEYLQFQMNGLTEVENLHKNDNKIVLSNNSTDTGDDLLKDLENL